MLGLVGGVSCVVWSSLGYSLGDYEQFRYKNSLAGSVYPTSPASENAESEGGAKFQMMQTVAERGKYFYTYSEYRFTAFLRSFCRCWLKESACYKSRLARIERHEEAQEKLSEEIDIIKIISMLRIGQFLSKLILRKH